MPKTIQLVEHPHGFAAQYAFEGESIEILPQDFLSSEDGGTFIDRLESISIIYHQAFADPLILPSQIDNFLAIVKPNLEAKVYINELGALVKARTKHRNAEIYKGQPATYDDLADIASVELVDKSRNLISIPPDCGFTLICSHGWRKGVCFDYEPLLPNHPKRAFDLGELFGNIIARLMFQEIYSITDAQVNNLTEWGWFPFIGLSHEDRKNLIGWASHARKPVPMLEGMAKRFLEDFESRLSVWVDNQYLAPHEPFLRKAKDHLDSSEFISCISVLYPRIEGIMRAIYVSRTTSGSPSQSGMSNTLIQGKLDHSMLLPEQFRKYIMDVYFPRFDERANLVPLSRHTVAHGVSKSEDYNFLTAAVGFLIVDQISYYLA